MAEVKSIAELPEPSGDLPAVVSYLRIGCTGCQHVRCFEIDGYDLIAQLNYGQAEDSSDELDPMIATLCLQGLPYAIVVEDRKETFGHLECKTTVCEHMAEIEQHVNLLTLVDLDSQL